MIGHGLQGAWATRRPAPATGARAWLAARPWLYPDLVLVVFAFAPLVRRLIGTGSLGQPILALPVLAMALPLATFVYGPALRFVNRRIVVPVWIWLGGFGVAAALGLAAGNGVGTIYAFGDFVLPALFAAWMTSLDIDRERLFDRIAGFMLLLSTPICLYAFYQFAFLPSWDRNWLIQSQAIAFGLPVPFGIRPWSTLNAPATFADFLVATILFNMTRLGRGGWVRVAQFVLVVAALVLTRVRADWIGAAIGIATYVALSPNRLRNLTLVGVMAVVIGGFTAGATTIFGSSAVGAQFGNRFATLGDLSQDASYQDRQKYFGPVLQAALAVPTGVGLGTTGPAARIKPDATLGVFDNGYVARLTEGGYFGFACFVAVLFLCSKITLSVWSAARRDGDVRMAAIAALALGFQLATDFNDISGDHHNSLNGMLYWLTLAFVLGRRTPATQ